MLNVVEEVFDGEVTFWSFREKLQKAELDFFWVETLGKRVLIAVDKF